MAKESKKAIRKIVVVPDYIFLLFFFPFCLVGLLFTIPWISKQRRIWNHSAKGIPKALILRAFTVEKVVNRGHESLLPFRNPSMKWTGILDPSNSVETEIEITNDLHIVTWKRPKIVKFMRKIRFTASAVILREIISIFKITSYCVKEQIGVLRVYKYDYPALQAFVVSTFIKIPFIVDIIGNLELVQRLTGKVYYFRELSRVPFIRIFTRSATNWLLGLPLRHAFRVLGRNKNNYEHAFALGAPVDRLSLLRISNFSAAFNSYNPEQPPAKPAKYPYLLFVGRLVEYKYPLDVLAAFDLAAPHLPEYRLIMIGDGANRHDVEQRKERSEYKDRIVLLGACSNDMVFNWTAHAKVAICPYSGFTLIEAMLCGIPVIAYDIEWHAEIVIDDYTGFLVPFKNIAALAEKMIYVVRNYDEARIAGMRGRELARVAFDKEKIQEKESMYYRQALTDSQN
jgi:glycosyltransferase involved in cell wall biosynthesis